MLPSTSRASREESINDEIMNLVQERCQNKPKEYFENYYQTLLRQINGTNSNYRTKTREELKEFRKKMRQNKKLWAGTKTSRALQKRKGFHMDFVTDIVDEGLCTSGDFNNPRKRVPMPCKKMVPRYNYKRTLIFNRTPPLSTVLAIMDTIMKPGRVTLSVDSFIEFSRVFMHFLYTVYVTRTFVPSDIALVDVDVVKIIMNKFDDRYKFYGQNIKKGLKYINFDEFCASIKQPSFKSVFTAMKKFVPLPARNFSVNETLKQITKLKLEIEKKLIQPGHAAAIVAFVDSKQQKEGVYKGDMRALGMKEKNLVNLSVPHIRRFSTDSVASSNLEELIAQQGGNKSPFDSEPDTLPRLYTPDLDEIFNELDTPEPQAPQAILSGDYKPDTFLGPQQPRFAGNYKPITPLQQQEDSFSGDYKPKTPLQQQYSFSGDYKPKTPEQKASCSRCGNPEEQPTCSKYLDKEYDNEQAQILDFSNFGSNFVGRELNEIDDRDFIDVKREASYDFENI